MLGFFEFFCANYLPIKIGLNYTKHAFQSVWVFASAFTSEERLKEIEFLTLLGKQQQ